VARSQAEIDKDQQDIDTFCINCMENFRFFASTCLTIKTKTDGLALFKFNKAQLYLNKIVDEMQEKYGKVRVIIVKGRQQGLSTWIQGRAYWNTIHKEGTKAFILTHEGEATKNLFNMTKRYHEYCPAELKPITTKSNSSELIFKELDSEYAVGTAKTGDTGRSQTIQFFHGSEVAYWRAAKEISDGAMEGIPDEPNTESYLESTASGFGGYFHSMWQNAAYINEEPQANWNGYIRVFVPWYWEPKYRIPTLATFTMTEEEIELSRLYDLDAEQLAWRRMKIANKEGNVAQFQREYPATPEDAFNSAVNNVLIDAKLVVAARARANENFYIPRGPVIMGVDVAREGDDSTAFVIRQGRVILGYTRFSKLDNMEVAGLVIRAIQTWKVDFVGIDSTGGYGAGVYDRLVEMGLGAKVSAINFASSAIDKDRFKNKRTEMWHGIRSWLEMGAQLPNEDEIQQDLCSVTYKFDSSGEQLKLERKDEMKKRGIKSPDIGDAIALTFFRPTIKLDGHGESYDPYSYFGEQ